MKCFVINCNFKDKDSSGKYTCSLCGFQTYNKEMQRNCTSIVKKKYKTSVRYNPIQIEVEEPVKSIDEHF